MGDDSTDVSDIDQQIRINELREAVREAAGDMFDREGPDCPQVILTR